MTAKLKTENQIPPYVSYKTFISYIETLREGGVPDRIDRSVMRNLSGTAQNQLVSALHYLGLMDEFQFPKENLSRLVSTEGTERQEVLREILAEAYPTILGESANGFRLQSASSHQFDEKFRELGVKGDTVRKCEYFFLAAAKEANIPVSPYIKPATHQGPEGIRAPGNGGRGRVVANTAKKVSQGTRIPVQQSFPISGDPHSPIPAKSNPAATAKAGNLQEMLATSLNILANKYPAFDPEWDGEAQVKWFESWERVADRLLTMLDKLEKTQLDLGKEME